MKKTILVIGNKNYSSWSLRAWLALRQVGASFQEIKIPLHEAATEAEILRYSPSGRVPVFIDGDTVVWESLGICEYLAERFPRAGLWPDEARARAFARSISSEMHAGFQALRRAMPMNVRARFQRTETAPDVRMDIGRITDIWRQCRNEFGAGGNLLFGRFTIPDAMFAPVVLRFFTYGVQVDSVSKTYMDAVFALPALQEWMRAAREETETIPEYDQLKA